MSQTCFDRTAQRILSKRDKRGILKEVRNNPRASAQTIAINVGKSARKTLCAETILKVFRKAGYKRRAAKKNYTYKRNFTAIEHNM